MAKEKTKISQQEIYIEKISEEELNELLFKRQEAQLLLIAAQKANSEARAADLDYKNHILKIYLKYKLNPDEDSLKDDTGEIIRKPNG